MKQKLADVFWDTDKRDIVIDWYPEYKQKKDLDKMQIMINLFDELTMMTKDGWKYIKEAIQKHEKEKRN